MNHTQEQVEARLARFTGQKPETRKAVAEANATAIWWGKCRVCGQLVEGTPAELRKHRHDPPTEPAA